MCLLINPESVLKHLHIIIKRNVVMIPPYVTTPFQLHVFLGNVCERYVFLVFFSVATFCSLICHCTYLIKL
jgi:hypothetical protein